MCADEEEEAGDGAAGRTSAEKQSRISKSAVTRTPPWDRIRHVWSTAHLMVRAANRMRDHATCARIGTLYECA